MEGFVQTVRGRISPSELGRTLTHEHVLWDLSDAYFSEGEEPHIKELAYSEITLENRADIFYQVFNNKCNLKQQDVDLAAKELTLLKNEGGGTVVDLTTHQLLHKRSWVLHYTLTALTLLHRCTSTKLWIPFLIRMAPTGNICYN